MIRTKRRNQLMYVVKLALAWSALLVVIFGVAMFLTFAISEKLDFL